MQSLIPFVVTSQNIIFFPETNKIIGQCANMAVFVRPISRALIKNNSKTGKLNKVNNIYHRICNTLQIQHIVLYTRYIKYITGSTTIKSESICGASVRTMSSEGPQKNKVE